MTSSRRRPKNWQILIIVVTLTLGLGWFFLMRLDKSLGDSLMSAKSYRLTSATVSKKEVRKFDETDHSYVNESGNTVLAKPGDEQYRVYFYFDDFRGYDDAFQSRLMQAEEQRILEGKPHYLWGNYNDRRLYDTVNAGDKLIVTYKAYSDGQLDILRAEKADGRR